MTYLISFIIIIGLLLALIAFNTWRFKPGSQALVHWQDLEVDTEAVSLKLSEAIKIPTISYLDRSLIDHDQFHKYHQVLEKAFPLVHERLAVQKINKYSLLYHWKGKDPNLKPILFMSHQDVVPIARGTENDWLYGPFSGAVAEGFVWGRGTMDTKGTTIGPLEAVESLLKKDFIPKQDIYLAFGHDEEIQGHEGAKAIADYLFEQGIFLDFILDEGGVVTTDSVAGVKVPVALIGLGEKGYTDIEVKIKGGGGHASMPPKSTALGQVATLISRVEKNPMKPHLTPAVLAFLKHVGPYMTGINKVAIANLWLFKPVFMKVFGATTAGRALLGTTIAATMSQASNATNVLPQEASVVFNCRINSLDSVEGVVNHIKSLCGDMPASVTVLQGTEPSKISEMSGKGYERMCQVIQHIFEPVVVSPYLMMAATDSVKYDRVCDHIYRFAPYLVSKEDLGSIHNTNERISLKNMERCVNFYMHMMMG